MPAPEGVTVTADLLCIKRICLESSTQSTERPRKSESTDSFLPTLVESGGYLTRCCLAVYVDASPVSPSFLTSLIARSLSLSLPFSLPSISHRPWPPRSPPLQSRPGRWRSVTTVPCLRLTCLRSESRVGIQRRADDNYVRKFCVAVVDLLLNFDHFWKFGHVSKSNIKSSARH